MQLLTKHPGIYGEGMPCIRRRLVCARSRVFGMEEMDPTQTLVLEGNDKTIVCLFDTTDWNQHEPQAAQAYRLGACPLPRFSSDDSFTIAGPFTIRLQGQSSCAIWVGRHRASAQPRIYSFANCA